MGVSRWILRLTLAATVSLWGRAQSPVKPAAGAVLPAASASASANEALRGGAADWDRAVSKTISLNRTPPLFDTDEPANAELSIAEVRCLHAGGKLFVQLSWQDTTRDVAALPAIPDTPPEGRFLKAHTDAGDRFFDAAAVMLPAHPGSPSNPSLQMGDAAHPVIIYYWNSVRGAMLMEASGRSTTRRTGQEFPAEAVYQKGRWMVTFELADQQAGTPIAFAIWNGSDKDRDGRKYFSVWYTLE